MRPKAVLISDIHFGINTLDLASAALRQAFGKAKELEVPLIVAGDLHDTKGVLRGECIKVIIGVFKVYPSVQSSVLLGNHDLINEKGKAHSLEFLKPYTHVVEGPEYDAKTDCHLIPYQTKQEELIKLLGQIPKGSTVICHQGVHGSYMGHYTQDRTSVSASEFAEFRTISGHYHMRQSIQCRDRGISETSHVGLFSYIGNPYTLNYGEAIDPPKGFQILNSDGSLTFVPTNLRKHIVVDRTLDTMYDSIAASPADKVKYRLHGLDSELIKINKKDIGNRLLGHCDFIFERVSPKTIPPLIEKTETYTPAESMDYVIDSSSESETHKKYLKNLWREIHNEDS